MLSFYNFLLLIPMVCPWIQAFRSILETASSEGFLLPVSSPPEYTPCPLFHPSNISKIWWCYFHLKLFIVAPIDFRIRLPKKLGHQSGSHEVKEKLATKCKLAFKFTGPFRMVTLILTANWITQKSIHKNILPLFNKDVFPAHGNFLHRPLQSQQISKKLKSMEPLIHFWG